MSEVTREFAEQYQLTLRDYLANGGEGPLHHAYEQGRQALGSGLALLDLASIHHEALTAALRDSPATVEVVTRQVQAAGHFFAESLSPFEMSHLSSQETNAVLRRLNSLLEGEAKRIAHALHDEAAQLLATVYLELAELAVAAPEPVRGRVGRVSEHLDQVREQLRRLSHELRPLILDQLGLLPALRFLADGVGKRTCLKVAVEGSTEGRLSELTETAVYRAVQEALANVTKHAGATRVGIRVWADTEGWLHCTVEDDGAGFDVAKVRGRKGRRGLGLLGIEERVTALHGKVEVTSAPGSGTVLHVSVPQQRGTPHEDSAG